MTENDTTLAVIELTSDTLEGNNPANILITGKVYEDS